MKKVLLLAAVIGFAITACRKKDKEAPTLTVHSPVQEAKFSRGDTIEFKADFEDNEELSQYKIDIHHGAGHTHKIGAEWDFSVIEDLNGTFQQVLKNIVIPTDADTGEYDMIIESTDLAGNEAKFVEINFDVQP